MAGADAAEAPTEARYRSLSPLWRGALIVLVSGAIGLALNQLLNLGFFVGKTLLDSAYLYWLCALLVGGVFLLVPAGRRARRDGVPWYDALLFALSFGVFAYFALHAQRIVEEGWEYKAPREAVWVAYVGWLMLLEATRRAGGTAVFVVVALVSLYPVFAGHMPGPISGLPRDLASTASFHFASSESALGIPTHTILLRHILPNALTPVIVAAALGLGNAILLEAGLSFLGLGVQPPTPSWGNLIASGRDTLVNAPWVAAAPGVALVIVVVAVNLMF